VIKRTALVALPDEDEDEARAPYNGPCGPRLGMTLFLMFMCRNDKGCKQRKSFIFILKNSCHKNCFSSDCFWSHVTTNEAHLENFILIP
jgi:hypothetical protein